MNPAFVDLGIVAIRWYSVFIFIALLLGGMYALNEGKKYGISEDEIINLVFWLIPFALIGARLYYVAFNWDYYSVNKLEILQVWNGGLAIHGALIAGLIYILIYTKRKKINTFRLLDIAVVALLLGQAIGRWGNFFNSEAYGPETTLAFLQSLHLPQFIIDGMFINGTYYQPTFLYESIWCLIGFALILIIKKRKYLKIGQMTGFYLVWYGIGRFFVESLRTDSLMLGNFKMAQIVSILMIISGIFLYIWAGRGSKFERLYNERKKVSFADLPQNIQQLQMKNLNQIINSSKAPATNSAPNSNNTITQSSNIPDSQQKVVEKENIDDGDAFKW